MYSPKPDASRFGSHLAPLIAILTYLCLLGGVAGYAWWECGGRFTYALDDAYIHMAIARNLAAHGVWGVSPHAFASASSSLLWPPLLALGFRLFGVVEWLPLLFNAAASIGAIVCANGILQPYLPRVGMRAAALVFLVLVTPMATLTQAGMEHSLHLLLTLAFAWQVVRYLDGPSRSGLAGVAGLALLLVMARYEGLFLVAVAMTVAVARGRIGAAVGMAAAAALPVLLFGWYSTQHGYFFLPNPLLLKPSAVDPKRVDQLLQIAVLARGWERLSDHWFFIGPFFRENIVGLTRLALAAAVLGVLVGKQQERLRTGPALTFAGLFLVATLLHLQFASAGWLYRYDAYLYGLGSVAVALLLAQLPGDLRSWWRPAGRWRPTRDSLPFHVCAVAAAVILAWPFVARMGLATRDAALAPRDRYLEHLWAAEFVRRFYNDGAVVLNDLGAIAFFTQARPLDMYGLGSVEPVRFRRQPGGYTAKDLKSWAEREQAPIAILQIEWHEVRERIPETWMKVCEWRVPRNVVFKDHTVAFYAVDPGKAARLRRCMEQFRADLPESVRITFFADEGADPPPGS